MRTLSVRLAVVLVFALLVSLACLPTLAQEKAPAAKELSLDSYLALARADLRTEKRALVTANMDLTAKESEAFWPVYDRYEREVMKLGDQKLALLKDFAAQYDTLTDLQAKELSTKTFEIQKARIALKDKFFKEFEKAVGGKKTARFFQVDARLELIVDVQITAEIPLIR